MDDFSRALLFLFVLPYSVFFVLAFAMEVYERRKANRKHLMYRLGINDGEVK
jgi:hypothetical protein